MNGTLATSKAITHMFITPTTDTNHSVFIKINELISKVIGSWHACVVIPSRVRVTDRRQTKTTLLR